MGSINIDNTGSGNGVILSSDGTDLLLDGSAIGGGGGGGDPDLYRDNASGATTPIASGTNAVALGSGGRASGTDTLAFNNNFSSYGASATGAIALGYKTRAQGSYSLAIGKNANSSGNGCISLGENSSATFNHGVAIGYGSYSLNNTHAVAIGYNSVSTGGGSYSLALMNSNSNGANSLAAQITNNTTSYGAQGANSIAIGQTSKASSSNAIALGSSNTSSGVRSVTLGGEVNTASAENSYAFGVRSVSDKIGQYAFGCWIGQQGGMMVLKADTNDATPKAMASNNSAAGSNNQIILPNNSAYAFHGTIIARQQASGGTACAAWKVEGLIRREANAGTTVLVNSATTVLDNTPSWGMALSADTTNGGLAITVNGAASTNVKFVANITTSELTYA